MGEADQRENDVAPEEQSPSTPRWVKVFAAVAAVVVVLVVVLVLVGGDHGPGRHVGGDGGHAPPADTSSPGEGHRPPVGGHSP